jgi:hypothetical protein
MICGGGSNGGGGGGGGSGGVGGLNFSFSADPGREPAMDVCCS